MNVLLLTLFDFNSLNENNIYTDLLREFVKNGHNAFVISPRERRFNEETRLITENHSKILKLKIGNIQKNGIIEKGVSTILLETYLKSGIKKYFSGVRFDLVLYSTPPITFAGVVKYIKKRDNSKAYLMLKDIFPQNAVDIGMMAKSGVKSIIYKFFRRKEKQLYKLSDYIGCMSQANVDYLIKNNPETKPEKVHICPNTIEIKPKPKKENKQELRRKYGIPLDKTVFIYGGNLGKPQDIPFVFKCLKANEKYGDRFFVVCGTGTEYTKLKNSVDRSALKNTLLINGLPKDEYESLVGCCDVGLIFLDHRFTIPNFPSRMLSYMQNGIPVLACTDVNTDVGRVIVDGGFGWWCESNSAEGFEACINRAIGSDLKALGENAFNYLNEHFSVLKSYNIINENINKESQV